MPEPTTFSIQRLNDRIYPLTYSVKTNYDVNVLYFTVASVEDAYQFMRDRARAYLYIFDVGHNMARDDIYLTLREILENDKIEAAHIYEDDIIVIEKEKFGKFLNFPHRDFKMFDYDAVMDDDEFAGFFGAATGRRKNFDVFMEIKNNRSGYYMDCHDDSLLYCESRDMGLKTELLRKMLRDYFEAYLEKNHKLTPVISLPPAEFVDGLFEGFEKLAIREEDTGLRDKSVDAVFYGADDRRAGIITYRIDKGEWVIKTTNTFGQ